MTVAPETPVTVAARVLLERRIGCLPVRDGETIIGIFTRSDALDALLLSAPRIDWKPFYEESTNLEGAATCPDGLCRVDFYRRGRSGRRLMRFSRVAWRMSKAIDGNAFPFSTGTLPSQRYQQVYSSSDFETPLMGPCE